MKIYDLTVKDAKGQDVSLKEYQGKVLLIVNTATRCGFTPQYNELQQLYDQFQSQGLEILDFPCNQFGNQAPEDEDGIKEFCEMNFGIQFRLFAKVDVNGENTDPLFVFLKNSKKGLLGADIKWNFTKFLVNRDGEVVKRYAPTIKPLDIIKDIKKIL